jgi:demethylspheroidene O-methyltransferase
MAQTPGAEQSGDAYFGFYLLAMGSGRPRSIAAIAGMLRAAGFSRTKVVPTAMPLTARAIVAIR